MGPNHKFGLSEGMEHVGMTAPASAVTNIISRTIR
ncbi:hypothetical protein Sros_1631 [Streptosporangium roseum DSM 43021]|uniref:Uncharacterized protein n=1 Tax=Streptosporangium roseum (strain ATCC 12428 / DSM 43021 / JCM 3005 / KCTC 9067 / NCIMB 10171 / NRRL 2505 / NI 9100) TaxID=479432 RepID=D2ARU3_STRRD|nr:hypothetical protein Sros_1631 [Streptosporangium roseum DSM 43021]